LNNCCVRTYPAQARNLASHRPCAASVLNIYKGADGAFANARRGALVIDLSTVSPQTSQELSRLGSERGISVLDVTISGSTPAAEQGALIMFGGGGETCFAAAESIFRVIARKIWPRAASHHPAMRRGAERAQALFGRGAASHHPGRDAAAGPNGRGHYLAEGRVPSSRTRSKTRRGRTGWALFGRGPRPIVPDAIKHPAAERAGSISYRLASQRLRENPIASDNSTLASSQNPPFHAGPERAVPTLRSNRTAGDSSPAASGPGRRAISAPWLSNDEHEAAQLSAPTGESIEGHAAM
jgi:hypothetical protein